MFKKKKKGWASEFETIVELSKRGASFGSVEENVGLPAKLSCLDTN